MTAQSEPVFPVSDKTPLRIWAMLSLVVLIGAIIFIPSRVGSIGYFPPDDAGRHIGKAISGKPWNQILVMRDNITTDVHHGWDTLLGFLHKRFGIGAYGLMAFSVFFCFALFAATPLFFLRRPESWLMALGLLLIFDPFLLLRFFLGRPFIVGCTALLIVYLTWEKYAAEKTHYRSMASLFIIMAITSWIAPTSAPLFSIPLIGFALARQWRALARLTIIISGGGVAGYLLTGYPIKLAKDIAFILFAAPDQNLLSRMLVTEFQPTPGNLLIFIFIGTVIVWRIIHKNWTLQAIDNPIFFNVMAGVILGHFVGRFWNDWGLIAAIVWLAKEADEILSEYFEFNSLKRFVLSAGISLCFFIILTSDVGSRWSSGVPRYPLQYSKATDEEKKWYPDSGGILYNDDMRVFYQTFFENPKAHWRYALGFEPILMLPEDLAVYRAIQRNYKSIDSYKPWIDKMRPCDRMVLFSESVPEIELLEWHCMNRSIWLGRLPLKTPSPIDKPTSKATAKGRLP